MSENDNKETESKNDNEFGVSEMAIIAAQRSTREKIWNHRLVLGFVRYPPAFVALIIASFFLFFAFMAPLIVAWDPNKPVLNDTLTPPVWSFAFNSVHSLGTDTVGRDVFVRILMGGRVSILLGVTGATGAATIGVVLGLIAGWKRGVVGAFIMRWADLQIALPLLLMALTVAAVFGPGLHILLILFSLWFWGPYARISEGLTLSLKNREFVEAARSIGATPRRIVFRHVLPHLFSPLLVLWSFSCAILIIIEASLSFLGVGIPPPTASWGSMLAEGRQYLHRAYWLAMMPGAAISMMVWSINTLGDRLRDVIDQRQYL
jgi:peptide/nickel transport system permease protein